MVMIASVPPNVTSTAMAITVFATKILAIPAPIAFGAIIDTTCAFRSVKCGVEQSCDAYHMTTLRWSYLLWTVCWKAVAAASFYISARYFVPHARYAGRDRPVQMTDHEKEEITLRVSVEGR